MFVLKKIFLESGELLEGNQLRWPF